MMCRIMGISSDVASYGFKILSVRKSLRYQHDGRSFVLFILPDRYSHAMQRVYISLSVRPQASKMHIQTVILQMLRAGMSSSRGVALFALLLV